MFHPFTTDVSGIALPDKFTYPFHYTPHPLCVRAVEELTRYLNSRAEWAEELAAGKMFGVLIVRDPAGNLGFLAAFSGLLAGRNCQAWFVPPVYDLQEAGGFFAKEEANITALNRQIKELECNPHYLAARQRLDEERLSAHQTLQAARTAAKEAQEARELRRQSPLTPQEQAALIAESQYQKAEIKRLKQSRQTHLSRLQDEVAPFHSAIQALKDSRKSRSIALQQQLFQQFRLLNGQGEWCSLLSLFAQTNQPIPPAGAGECAGPRLLQQAYLTGLHPLAMAEVWWGASPKGELRRHGHYYPACQSKCAPILHHMLQGLTVEDNPLESRITDEEVAILWEDEQLVVVNKPAGLLSVPGKLKVDSLLTLLARSRPEAVRWMVVHRLDMATSGLLLLAKTGEVYRDLQAQFAVRTVRKRYVALLEGRVEEKEGTLSLPLCPDISDRPRQKVCPLRGRPAETYYRVLGYADDRTRIALYPHTGRTHQLRVHAAHAEGLNSPIVGDTLYGRAAERLYLHAESLEFTHPITHLPIRVEAVAPF